jgi:hypothetical protein
LTGSAERKTIAYYITPHGFGHAVRSLEVIRCLLTLDPLLDVVIVSDLPEFLIEQNVGRPLRQRRKRLDVGLIQKDSVRFDLDATFHAVSSLHARQEELVSDEIRFLQAHAIGAIVADVPFLAFLVSHQQGITGIGLGNFTWDWIYHWYARNDSRWVPLVKWIRECYGRCDLFLQLPMHGDCSVCPYILDVPLVARKARRNSDETRRILGCGKGKKSYLVSFTALDLDEEAQQRLEAMEDTMFFYKRPLRLVAGNARSLDEFTQLSYADVIAAMDGVITKPGYGIVSDCLANGTSMVYTDRGNFPEYDILVEEIERSLTAVHMPSGDLYSGNWGPFLRRLDGAHRSAQWVRTDGANVCANAILERLGRGEER